MTKVFRLFSSMQRAWNIFRKFNKSKLKKPTSTWHSLNTSLNMIWHCRSAQDFRVGYLSHMFITAEMLVIGHEGFILQLFPKSNGLETISLLGVCRSLFSSSSKLPHNPQTLPCYKLYGKIHSNSDGFFSTTIAINVFKKKSLNRRYFMKLLTLYEGFNCI